MTFIPEEPEVPAEQKAEGDLTLRYEDISQTGKLLIPAMPMVLGASIWRILPAHPAAQAMRASGCVPLLSRLVCESRQGPLSPLSSVKGRGSFDLAHTVAPNGEVERIVLNMWCDIHGEAGRAYGPPPDNAGEVLHAGRVFAEHVLTRPFGPKENRKVVSLDAPGVPRIPPSRYEWRPSESALELPEGATFAEDTFQPDAPTIVFGLDHTDSNQHVNSLVYPRLFIEAGLRRLAALGKKRPLLARRVEIAYRKPSFAGEQARVFLRGFVMANGGAGVAAMLVDAAEASSPIEKMRARVFARIVFEED